MSALAWTLLGDAFALPAALWLLPLALVPLVLARRGRGAILHAPERLAAEVAREHRLDAVLRFVPPALASLSAAAWILALAQPIERVPQDDGVRGIDIVLCIDTSSSMAALDLDPARSRLEVARAAAERFIRDRSREAIGLVRFARFPDLACPTTRDHEALRELLIAMLAVEADGPEDRTGIGSAIALGARALRRSDARSRVLVLLTDGEENVATAATPDEIGPARAGALCRELGIRTYAIAVGRGKRDASGSWLPLDTKQLEGVARETGGAFFAAADANALDAIYARIDKLETQRLEEERFATRDAHQGATLLALILALLALLAPLRALGVQP